MSQLTFSVINPAPASAATTDGCFSTLCPVSSWPSANALSSMGEICGLDVDDSSNNVVVLHRADRQWKDEYFNRYNTMNGNNRS